MPLTASRRRQALVVCLAAVGSLVACAVLVGAAVLVPAPPVVVPLLCVVCLGLPLLIGVELRDTLARLHAPATPTMTALTPPDLAALRAELARLPEVDHPLDL